MYPPKNILVPTDFSVYSDNALKEAVKIAEQNGSKIYLLHVVDEICPLAEAYCLDNSIVDQAMEQIMTNAEEKLQNEVKAIGASKGIEIVYDLKEGNPAETILKEQKDKKIDLIVIASNGYKTAPYQISSISHRVLREADCPVTLIK